MEIKSSRIYSILDERHNFSITFFDGRRLISELYARYDESEHQFPLFRGAVLSSMLLTKFLKHGEQFGFYFDFKRPDLIYKLECNAYGDMRTMISNATTLPLTPFYSGVARIVKFSGSSEVTTPYQSIVDFNDETLEGIMNKVLSDSYQVKARQFLSSHYDLALMIHKLPSVSRVAITKEELSFEKYLERYIEQYVSELLNKSFTDEEEFKERVKMLSLQYLMGTDINFRCPCSRENMVRNLKTLYRTHKDEISDGDEVLRIKCDYCKKDYEITVNEIKS